MSVQGSPSAGFVPPQPEPLAQRVYALKRRRWRQAYADWIADGRPDFLVLEPTVVPAGAWLPFLPPETRLEGR